MRTSCANRSSPTTRTSRGHPAAPPPPPNPRARPHACGFARPSSAVSSPSWPPTSCWSPWQPVFSLARRRRRFRRTPTSRKRKPASSPAPSSCSAPVWTVGRPARHEPRTAAAGTRFPGAAGHARPLRVRLRGQMGCRPRSHHLASPSGGLARTRLGRAGADQDRIAHRHAERTHHRAVRRRAAQHIGIAAVEIKTDNGPWEGDDAVRRGERPCLAHALDRDHGRTHQVVVRATDKSGARQTAARAGTVPDGATGWHSVTFIAN